MDTTLSESLEDYLEAIFHIVNEKGAARPKDISKRMEVGNSSVTGALKALAARELVNYAPYDLVTLTTTGEEIARDVVHRHESLRDFFVKVLATDASLAEQAACRMEHAVPGDLLDRFIKFVEFVEMCPRGGPGLLEGFRVHLDAGCRPDCFDQCPAADGESGLPIDTGIPGRTTTLADLESGQRAKVVRVYADGPLRRRLVDHGLTAGTEVSMERTAPLGDPIEIIVKGTHLSLRRQEAAGVEVEVEE